MAPVPRWPACHRPRARRRPTFGPERSSGGAACRLTRLPPARPATGPPSLYLRRRLPGAAAAAAPCGLAPHRRQWPRGPMPRGGQRACPAKRQRPSRLSPSAGGRIPAAGGGRRPAAGGGGWRGAFRRRRSRGWGGAGVAKRSRGPARRPRQGAEDSPLRGSRRIHAKARHTAAREGRAPLAVPCAAGTAAPPRAGARLRAPAPSAPASRTGRQAARGTSRPLARRTRAVRPYHPSVTIPNTAYRPSSHGASPRTTKNRGRSCRCRPPSPWPSTRRT